MIHMVGYQDSFEDPQASTSITHRPKLTVILLPFIMTDSEAIPKGSPLGSEEYLEIMPELAVSPTSSPKPDDRIQKLAGAVRTILECIGEDPNRQGLRETPMRYAKAMLYFTKGYEESAYDLVNGAIFKEDCNELVVVKNIDVSSLCEHHLVPFTGKVFLL